MKIRGLLAFLLLFGFLSGFSQYLSNPSFEGTLLMIGPPDGWEICDPTSTPNVQPGKYDIYLPASHGNTYIGLLTRENFTWEDMYSVLDVPLSKDSCYEFKIDLAYQAVLSFTYAYPIILNVYGSESPCSFDNLLYTSPAISNLEWVTYEFLIHNEEFDITSLILETYYTGTYPYWGYMLLDNIRITATPKFELGNDTTLTMCEVDSLILDPGPGFNAYLWQDGSTQSTYSVDTTGLYWVQAFNGEGCSWTDSVYVTVEEYIPMVSAMIDSTLVCEGQEITIYAGVINGAEPYSYQWVNLPDTTESIVVTVDSTTYFYVMITDKCDNVLLDSIKVVTIDNPDIDLGGDTLICPDGDYELSPGGGYSQYLWQDGSTDSTFTVIEPGLYWVEVTSSLGCVGGDSIYIDLFPPINFNLGNDTVLCLGETVTFFAGDEFVEYLWQDNSTDPDYTANSTGNYWVTVTDDNGCHATDTVFAEFLPAPVVNLGADTSLCLGQELILDAGGGFISYQWQDNDTSQHYVVTQGGLYWVTVQNGCGEDTDTLYVEPFPSPEPYLGVDTVLCKGESLVLDPGSQYSSYLWQDNSTFPVYTVNNTGYYSVTVTNFYNCPGTDEIFVDFSSTDVNLGPDTTLCIGDTIFLDPGQGFTSYLWQDGSSSSFYPVVEEGLYAVQVIDSLNCMGEDSLGVESILKPVADLGDDMPLCIGETLTLETTEGPYTYKWDGVAGGTTKEVSEGGTYTVEVSNICGTVSDQIVVTEFPIPSVYLGENQIILDGETIELDAGDGFDNYVWQDGAGGRYYIVTATSVDPDNPYYFVEVTDGPCKNSDTTEIVLFRVKIPNVFTPNGDGNNDTFTPMDESWSGVNKHHIEIFNRWGEKVWESDNFEEGWDGKRDNRFVAEGTYFWVLDVYYGEENVTQRLKGTVTVLGINE